MNSWSTCIASTSELREEIFRLRYEVYTEELQSFKREEFLAPREHDEFDEYAVHIALLHKNTLAGTLRLVPDNPHGFVMESMFTLPSWIDRAKTVEHSRGIIRAEYRGMGLYTLLLHRAYTWQKEHSKQICIGAPNTAKLSDILTKEGWLPFGEATSYHGITVIPMAYTL